MGFINLAGYKVFSYDKIPSTQDIAYDMVVHGKAADKTAVVALAQSAGRGRYKRRWISHHGNLYVSFIYDADVRDGRLSYAVAVAVAETLISFGIRPNIKWPNDILIDNKKVSGILIEYCRDYVIVGIGINVKTNPTVTEYQTTKLDKYTDVSANDLLGRLMHHMDVWRNTDFALVRNRWLDLVVGLNKDVIYHGASAELIGINENGALILRRGNGYLLVYGDEITMPDINK